jgi:flagellar biosynthetic protein FliQ
MTLTFVPKVLAMMIVFWATMGFMTETMMSFFQDRIIPLIAGG